MSDRPYTARAEVWPEGHLHRRARIALDVEIDMGVHGSIRELFRLQAARERPLPVDYIVAATGG
jgi:hypothetical protein